MEDMIKYKSTSLGLNNKSTVARILFFLGEMVICYMGEIKLESPLR